MAEKRLLSEFQASLLLALAVIGLGDLWRIPALAASHGGGAFVLVYVFFILLLGLPVLLAELHLGRIGVPDPGAVSAHRGMRWIRRVLPWSVLLAVLALISLYGPAGAWSFAYVFRAASGAATGLDHGGAEQLFRGLVEDPERSLLWLGLFWFIVGVCSAHGWRLGVWRAAVLFAGFIFPLSLILADLLPTLTQNDDARFWSLRWHEMGVQGYWDALRQACFTLAPGLGLIFVIGRRLAPEVSILKIAINVVVVDLFLTLVLGAAVVTLLPAQGAVNSGAQMVFVDLVVVMAQSRAAMTLLFGLFLCLALMSALLLIEGLVQRLQHRLDCSRVTAAACVASMAWGLGLLSVLFFGPWRALVLAGRSPAEWSLLIGIDLFVPLNCLLIATLVSRVLPASSVALTAGLAPGLFERAWRIGLRYPARLLLLLMLLYSSGLISAVGEFFSPVDMEINDREF